MPCKCDYLEPTEREIESVQVASLLVYLLTELKKPVPPLVLAASKQLYGNVATVDNDTDLLCSTLKSLSKQKMKTIVYDGSKPKARKLAEWWDKHQEADRKREEALKEIKKINRLRASAKKKLSPAERAAIGI